MRKPENIKGVLPPSFRAWYQLLRKVEKANIEHGGGDQLKTVVWHEPKRMTDVINGTQPQGYEFTLDEIKARAFDELREGVGNILDHMEKPNEIGPFSRESLTRGLLIFLKSRYFQK
jgi:hypothetical protein